MREADEKIYRRIEENRGKEYADRLRKAPYGYMCMNPDLCQGKGYCPRDPTCGD